jgi:hypothetical protein
MEVDVSNLLKIASILHGMNKSEQNSAIIWQNFQVSLAKFSKKSSIIFQNWTKKSEHFTKFHES